MSSKTRKGFTLVELLVVIGIIAVLIGILLPTLNRVRAQANTTVCGTQLRTLVQGLLMYASENRGTMPHGLCYQFQPATGSVAGNSGYSIFGGTFYHRYDWAHQVSAMLTKDKFSGLWPGSPQTGSFTGETWCRLPNKVFRCPEVEATVPGLIYNSYGFNSLVMPNRSIEALGTATAHYDGAAGGSGMVIGGTTGTSDSSRGIAQVIGPARSGQLFPDTALLWDTQQNIAYGTIIGLTGQVPWTGVDGGALLNPQDNGARYRGVYESNPSNTDPGRKGANPTFMPTDAFMKANSYLAVLGNADGSGTYYVGYFPNIRYRHQRNTAMNVGFADGSVRALTCNTKKLAYTTDGGDEICQHEFLRKFLQIKKPGGLPSLTHD